MEIFQVTEKQYGWIFALIAMGLIGASQVNSLLLKNYTSEQLIKIALRCQSIIGITMVCLSLLGWSDLFVTIFLIFIFLCTQGFVFPNASALSLAAFGHTAGSASALLGRYSNDNWCVHIGIGKCIAGSHGIPMSGVMAFCAITALSVFLFGRRIITQRASKEIVKEEDVEMISTL